MALSSNLTTFSDVTDGAPLSPAYLNAKFGVLDKNINQLNVAATGSFPTVFSITSYGASTGATGAVNTASIQTAINAAEAVGGTVFIPTGTFLLGGTTGENYALLVSKGVRVLGAGWGSVLKLDTGAHVQAIRVSNVTAPPLGVTFSDFAIDGNGLGRKDAGLLQLNNAEGFLIDHVFVHGGGSSTSGVDGVGVALGASAVTASRGVIINSLATGNSKAGFNVSTDALDVYVGFNRSSENSGIGTTPGFQVNGGLHTVLEGNIAELNQGRGFLVSTNGTTKQTNYGQYIGNSARSNGGGTSQADGFAFVNIQSNRSGRLIVVGNQAMGNGVATASVNARGFLFRGQTNVIVADNISDHNRADGFWFDDCEKFNVIGNNATDNGNQLGLDNVAGYRVDACNDGLFLGNSASNSESTQYWGLAFSGSTSTGIDLASNRLDSCQSGGVLVVTTPANPQPQGQLSLATLASTDSLIQGQVGLVFAASGMSVVVRSSDTVYDIGSNTSAAV